MAPASEAFNVEAVRADFPILRRTVQDGQPLVYLDNAATTQKPTAVLEAIDDFYRSHNANVHRGLHTLSMEASEMYEQAHAKVARFIGARDMEEVAFTQGTTDSLNTVAYGFGLRHLEPGDEVVGSVMEHHSNLVPWQQMCKLRGARYRHIPLTDAGMLDMEAAKEMITSATRVVAVTAMSNVLGTRVPVREIADLAHDRDALLVVDGAQSVPHSRTDVAAMDADVLAFSSHKMLGPTGVGALYGKKEVLEALDPFRYGGEMIKRVSFEESQWNTLPWKFEAGTPMIGPGIGFGAAVDYLSRLGMDAVRQHEEELTRHVLDRLSELEWVTIYGPAAAKDRGGLIAFGVRGMHAHDVSDALDQHGVAVRAGHHCAQPLSKLLGVESTTRASFYVYNTLDEVDRFVDVLTGVYQSFLRHSGKGNV